MTDMPEKNSVTQRNTFELRIGLSLASVICAITFVPLPDHYCSVA